MERCTHCGRCCFSGIPCTFGQILFDITADKYLPCPASESGNELYWCGLIWKCEAMADIAGIYIGIGFGCGMNPTQKEIKKRLEAKFLREHLSSKVINRY